MANSTKTKPRTKKPTPKSKYESWLSMWWRPAMAWVYLIICICDFIVFPVLFGLYSLHAGANLVQNWIPLTLQGGGLVHIAFGSVLGITSYTRGTEKTALLNYQTQNYQSYPQQYVQNQPYVATSDFSVPVDTTTPTTHSTPIKRPVPRIKA